MAKESPTPIGRGEGSISPQFTAPSVNVATPGRQLQPQQTDFERFRDSVLLAGRGVASAVSARSAINSRLKTLKEQSIARVEQDLNRSARSLQSRRLEKAVSQRQNILVEAETRGMEYAERRFRSAMLNASSAEESQVWEQAWVHARDGVKRDNDEAEQQKFNSAARTMEHTALSLRQELAENPALEATLIGNGQDIGARVQDWMLTEIGSAVNLDTMTEEDASVLIHQAIKQSFSIADGLTRTYVGRVEESNEIIGTEQVQADFFSTLTGEQDASRLSRQLDVTVRDRLNHLSPEKQRDFLRRVAESQLSAMADGQFGIDALDKLGTASSVLNMSVSGVPLFNQADRTMISADMLTRAERTARREVQAEISRMRESLADVITLPNGKTTRRPSANPDAVLSAPDPITGLTPLDEMSNRVLSEMGLDGDPEQMSPEAAAIVGSVRDSVAAIKGRMLSDSRERVFKAANANTVFSGQPGGNANKAHGFSFERRVYMDASALTASEEAPLSGVELDTFKTQLMNIVEVMGDDPSIVRDWDGSPLDYSDENRDLNRVIAINEARKWSNTNTQAQYGMPTDLVQDKLSLLGSDDPNRLEAFANWALYLDSGNNEAWDNFITNDAVDQNASAAAQWVRVHSRLGQPVGNMAPDFTALMAQVQAIQSAAPVTGWFRSETGDVDLETSHAGNMAQVMSDIIADESDAEFEGDEKDRFNRRMESQLREMFMSETNTTGRMLRNLWFAGRAVNPDMDDTQIGAMVWTWLKKDGHRFRSVGDRTIIVIDPQGYTGPQGGDIQKHVSNSFMREFTPEFRAFLQESLALEKPMDVPVNLQQLFFTERYKGTDPRMSVLNPRWSLNEQVTDRLLESRAGFGGFVIQAQTAEGEILPLPVAQQDATLVWPDGSSVFVPKGTVLSVINPDLFAPIEESEAQSQRSFFPQYMLTP